MELPTSPLPRNSVSAQLCLTFLLLRKSGDSIVHGVSAHKIHIGVGTLEAFAEGRGSL